jgi:thioredoxin-related protein
MSIRNKNYILLFLLFFFSCKNGEQEIQIVETPNDEYSHYFASYLNEAFQIEPADSLTYFLFYSQKKCSFCEKNVQQELYDLLSKDLSSKLMIISDTVFDDAVVTKFNSNFLLDSAALFSTYSFPFSYLVLYKVEDKKLKEYAYDSNPLKWKSLKEEILFK